ncbi:tetratricopeptide repeat protein [Gimesia aquarii]|uniref:Tetratricopeptide repeat protein n=1 Tax=Gimesia aquarii TaxID=2527964 RepID=A0A517VVW1_9PLAN|nr:tetratricopeptide repeat protein [Gimesia aquarii]QDT97144.1 Tetratricopeptide repeat protein [Gimesia aquarii]
MRFDKLEFDSTPEESGREDSAPIEKDFSHWVREADHNRRIGQYENALRYYSRALEEDKTHVMAWVGQVQMLVLLCEYPQAKMWSQKALELFPNNPDLLSGQSQAECRLGNIKAAHTLSDAAIMQRGESAYQWQVRGELSVATKKTGDVMSFDKAFLANNDWLVSLETALIYLFYRSYSKAQQRARVAVEKSPDSFYCWYILGVCGQKLGFTSSAEMNFTRCLELCPNHVEAEQRLFEINQSSWSVGRFLKRMIGRK